MIRPDLSSTARTVVVIGLALPLLIGIALLGGCPMSDWYARRMPPRSFNAVRLEAITLDLERTGVIPLGATWGSENLKSRRVSLQNWLLPTDREVVAQLSKAAGVVISYPMGYHGEILGPLHIKAAVGRVPGVECRQRQGWSMPAYAAGR